mgnify:CR=1 FL=1
MKYAIIKNIEIVVIQYLDEDKTMYKTAIVVWVGLTFGNFVMEAFGERKWGRTAEISFFQALAIGAFVLVMDH